MAADSCQKMFVIELSTFLPDDYDRFVFHFANTFCFVCVLVQELCQAIYLVMGNSTACEVPWLYLFSAFHKLSWSWGTGFTNASAT